MKNTMYCDCNKPGCSGVYLANYNEDVAQGIGALQDHNGRWVSLQLIAANEEQKECIAAFDRGQVKLIKKEDGAWALLISVEDKNIM